MTRLVAALDAQDDAAAKVAEEQSAMADIFGVSSTLGLMEMLTGTYAICEGCNKAKPCEIIGVDGRCFGCDTEGARQ